MRLQAVPACLLVAGGLATVGFSRPPARSVPPEPPTSAEWLARLPDGETKRQFIIDCTNCHQLESRHFRPLGAPRPIESWVTATQRMLGYAGATTGFPVISGGRDPERTAEWLVRNLGESPQPAARVPLAAAAAEIREYLLPDSADLPHDVAVERTGRIVVTGMRSHAMHLLEPESGVWSTIEIPVAKSNPRAVELDASGNWWVVLGGPHQLARYDGTEWATWDVGMYAHSVALDSAGGAWVNGHFTQSPELLASIARAGGVRTHLLPPHPTLATGDGGPVPYELRTGPNGTIWMSELQGNRIVAFHPSTGKSDVYPMPTTASGPRRLDVDQHGVVWIPTYGAGHLVRLDPSADAASRFEEIPLPIKDAAPYIARVHPRTGTIWIGTGTADAVFAYHPRERRFDYYPLPSRGALVRHLTFDPRSNDVWLAYGESPGKGPARIARLRPVPSPAVDTVRLAPGTALTLVNARAAWVAHRERPALHLLPLAGHEQDSDQEMMAVLAGTDFEDGTIEIDVSGARRAGYATDNVSAYKGFVGLSFRVRGDSSERFYLRPENARLEDELFRNRAVQYEASPDAPWNLLRQSSPGVYESYADMEAGGWTRMKIAVTGNQARLYINGASQPALVVNDLKHGTGRGAIALWARISSDAYFSNLRVTPK